MRPHPPLWVDSIYWVRHLINFISMMYELKMTEENLMWMSISMHKLHFENTQNDIGVFLISQTRPYRKYCRTWCRLNHLCCRPSVFTVRHLIKKRISINIEALNVARTSKSESQILTIPAWKYYNEKTSLLRDTGGSPAKDTKVSTLCWLMQTIFYLTVKLKNESTVKYNTFWKALGQDGPKPNNI